MAKQKPSALGRGLDAIFLDNTVEGSGTVSMLRLSDIEPNPDQPRRTFKDEDLRELAESIAEHGLIQPIIVRSSERDGYYQIIAGERRWRACKMAGLTEVPVIVMELDNKKAAQVAIIENIQRKDLNPIEEAMAYKTLMTEYEMTQEELSTALGKNRSTLANSLRLLSLPRIVGDYVRDGDLPPAHARTLLGLKNKDRIEELAAMSIVRKYSAREVEKMVKRYNKIDEKLEEKPKDTENSSENGGSGLTEIDYTEELAKKMTSRLGYKVSISRSGAGGNLMIRFSEDKELDDIVTLLCGDNIFDE